MKFNYQNTVKVYFTKDECDIVDFVKNNKFEKLLFITGTAKTKNIASNLKEAFDNCEVKLLSGVETNANVNWIEQNITEAKKFSPDVIITVGGGSVHDTGKALAIMLESSTDVSIEDYTVNGSLSVPGIKKVLPVITIPTLFGSGAEVSPAALIRINNEKRVIFSPLLHPIATFINIEYAKSLTTAQVARSSFDSLIQALEGFISLSSNNISDVFASSVLELFNECYPAIADGEFSDEILEKLAIASIFSSYVCSTASVGAIHALSDPISGRFNVHHGEALALVALPVLEKNLSVVDRTKIEKIDLLLSKITSFETDCVDRILNKISTIIQKCDILKPLDCCLTDEMILDMAKETMNPDMSGNPYDFSNTEIISILRKVFYA